MDNRHVGRERTGRMAHNGGMWNSVGKHFIEQALKGATLVGITAIMETKWQAPVERLGQNSVEDGIAVKIQWTCGQGGTWRRMALLWVRIISRSDFCSNTGL